MAFNRINNPPPIATPPAAAGAPAAAPINAAPYGGAQPARPLNTSIYGGLITLEQRDPMLNVGSYRLKIVDCTQGYNEEKRRTSYKVSAVVVEAQGATAVGSNVAIIFSEARKGLADLKAFTMAGAGCGVTLDDVQRGSTADAQPIGISMQGALAQFDAIEAQYGGPGALIVAGLTKAEGVPNVIGESVDVIVSRGKDLVINGVPSGDWFRSYRWCVAPQE